MIQVLHRHALVKRTSQIMTMNRFKISNWEVILGALDTVNILCLMNKMSSGYY